MISLNYKASGEGFPFIFIHGFCETNHVWESLSSKLPVGLQSIAIDLPGFGESKPFESEFSIDKLGEQLNEWTKYNKLIKPILVGHSLGGYVSLAMASLKPSAYSGLVLLNSTARPDSTAKKENRLKVMEFIQSNGVEPFIRSFIPQLFYIKDHPAMDKVVENGLKTSKSTFLSYTEAMRSRESHEHLLASGKIPICLIGGQEDTVIMAQDLEEQASLNPEIRLLIVPKSGHMSMLESENAVVGALVDFAASVKRRLNQ